MKLKIFNLSNCRGRSHGENYLVGFTLIELLVVVAIIGILATVVVVNLSGAQNKARDAKVKADMETVQKAASLYYLEKGNYSGLGCAASTCDSLAGAATDTNIQTIVNAAKDIKTVLSASDGLGIITNTSNYQASAKLPSMIGKSNPQSVVVSDTGGNQTTNSSLTGLIGWWKLNEGSGTTTADSSIYKRPSVSVSGAGSWTTISPSSSGNALSLNGSSYLTIGNSNSYLPFTTFSICAREKTSSLAGQKGMTSFGYRLSLYIASNNGNFQSLFMPNSVPGDTKYPTAGGNYADGNSHSLCLTYDGTNIRMYADGVLKNTTASAWDSTWTTATPLAAIGAENNNPAISKFNGILNDVRFYNRAISAEEVTDIYNNPI